MGYVEENQETLTRLRQVLARASDDDLRRELPNGWTIVDTLGHLAFYDRRAEVLLRRYASEGVFASPYDYDTINDALLNLTRRLPPRAMAEEALAAADAADRAAAETSPDLLPEIERLNQVRLDRAHHRRNHLAEIEALLGS